MKLSCAAWWGLTIVAVILLPNVRPYRQGSNVSLFVRRLDLDSARGVWILLWFKRIPSVLAGNEDTPSNCKLSDDPKSSQIISLTQLWKGCWSPLSGRLSERMCMSTAIFPKLKCRLGAWKSYIKNLPSSVFGLKDARAWSALAYLSYPLHLLSLLMIFLLIYKQPVNLEEDIAFLA
jgi:hypothetical protein